MPAVIVLLALGAFGVLAANAAVKPKKLTIACASKSTGGLRYVTKASKCKSSETAVDLSKNFFQTCVKQHGHRHESAKARRLPAGSTRLVTSLSLCAPDTQPNEKGWVLPATTKQWFCARKSDGRLRWVVRKPKCNADEFVVYLNGRKQPIGGGTTPGQQNNAPVADADSAATDEDSARALAVLGNDTDADGNGLTVHSVDTAGTRGSVTVNGDGTITYDPNHQFESLAAGATATDSFKYRASDGSADSNTATVTLTITGVDDAPALAGTETTKLDYFEGSAATAVSPGITVGGVDDGKVTGALVKVGAHYAAGADVLEFTNAGGIKGTFNGASGELTLTGAASKVDYQAALRSVRFRSSGGGGGDRGIDFRVGGGGSNSNTVTRTLHVDQRPAANDDTKTLDEDAALTAVDVLGNDTDTDGGP